MDPQLFHMDLEATPSVLRALATSLRGESPWSEAISTPIRRIVLLGMGSSHFANSILALRLQAVGIPAYAALASADPLPAVTSDDLVISVSASGGSAETVAATKTYTGKCRIVAVTNSTDTVIEHLGDLHVPMQAQPEQGGVACRSFANTMGLHLNLLDALTGATSAPAAIEAAADAADDLLGRASEWVPTLSELLLGPDGTAIVAPARRFSSAQQSALMLREGPRLPAIAAETGDWSHIDVYLTKTTDYRMLLLSGSPWEAQLMEWCTSRGSTVVCAGGDTSGATYALRYANDANDDARLMAEPLIAELIAARAWGAQG